MAAKNAAGYSYGQWSAAEVASEAGRRRQGGHVAGDGVSNFRQPDQCLPVSGTADD